MFKIMSVNTRTIRRRIKSVASTKKITKAMELVSASKMRRAVNNVLASRPYAVLSWETLAELSKLTGQSLHPLLIKREPIKKVLLILVTSDRGLCGGFNAQILKQASSFVKQAVSLGQVCDVVTIGKKGQDAARRFKWNVVATFNNLSVAPAIVDVRPIATLAIDDFKKGVYEKVVVAYTDFISSLKQTPRLKQLLPFVRSEQVEEVSDEVNKYTYDYLFEPSPAEVLEVMLPRLVEMQIYQAILESSASEQSARMMAMSNATQAANDMIDDLTFTFNQVRQAAITREIAEISAGKAAIE